jgi:hypothetical protein
MATKVFWSALLATPTLLGAALIMSTSAVAAELQPNAEADALFSDISIDLEASNLSTQELPLEVSAAPQEAVAPEAQADVDAVVAVDELVVTEQDVQVAQVASEQPASEVSSLDEILQYSNNQDALSQVTSITQLSDVRPEDWAFQALQSLVERYGCIAGYPDGTYRGQSAMTRYEFAAGLNACLDRISELIAASTADLATREDLATLQRLQEEFAAELATLRGRVDNLEARVAELEANQFSTTTKLRGETIFAVAVPFDYDDDVFEDSQSIGGYRVRLNFDTSFTGEDLLRARLQARNFNDFDSLAVNGMGWSFGSGDSGSSNLALDDLLYTFPVGNVQVIIGANSIGDSDFVATTVSPFDSGGQGSLTNFGVPQQYQVIPGGFGAGAIVQFSDNFSLDFGYAAGEAGDSANGAGLFNGDYGAIVQLSFLSEAFDAAVMYSNSYANDDFFLTEDRPQVRNVYGAQVNFKLADFIQIGGGVAYIPTRVINRGDFDVWSYQGTVAFPDLGGEGNLLGILFGAPLYARGFGDGTFFTGLSETRGQRTPFAIEGFYRFRVTDRISITPGVIWLNSPGGDDDASDTFAGAIRTTFSF